MAANEKQRAGGSGGEVFDVRVVAFAGGSAATLQALQDLFGLDPVGAQRLVDNVPLVVRRAAPANEAQSFVEALRSIGAQVLLERPSNTNAGPTSAEPVPLPRTAAGRPAPPAPPAPRQAPPPPKAAAGKAPPPPPRPREAEPLPRPIVRAPTADLEFDFAGSGSGDSFDSEPKSAMQTIDSKKTANRSRNEFAFEDEPDSATLELDTGSVRSASGEQATIRGPVSERSGARKTVSERAAAVRAAIAERAAMKTPQPAATAETSAADSRSEQFAGRISNPDLGRGGPGPMSRAAVVHKPGVDPKDNPARRRQIALLRLLGAVAIGALGIQFDSSILYGNANPLSLIAHAVAIYQLGVGLRGMAP